MRKICFSLFYFIVSRTSLVFGQLVEQNDHPGIKYFSLVSGIFYLFIYFFTQDKLIEIRVICNPDNDLSHHIAES